MLTVDNNIDNYYPDRPAITDEFNRKNFSVRVAQSIASLNTEESLVFGINGVWGEGKSTVLNFIKNELEISHYEDTVMVNYAPWQYGTEAELLTHLFESIAGGLKVRLRSKADTVAKDLVEYSKIALDSLPSDFVSQVADVKCPGSGRLLDTCLSFLKMLPNPFKGPSVIELKKRIDAFLRAERKCVVIFIDDIDRLDKLEIRALFRIIKLNADFPFTRYVMPFDEEVVASAIGDNYGGQGGAQSGRCFLEKIIQVPLQIPKAPSQLLKDFFNNRLNALLNKHGIKLDNNERDSIKQDYNDFLKGKLITPRLCNRYLNRVMFLIPLAKSEVNIRDFLLVEAASLLYPELYFFMRDNEDLLLLESHNHGMYRIHEEAFTQRVQTTLDALTNNYSPINKLSAYRLLSRLFPIWKVNEESLKFSYQAQVYQTQEWFRAKRVASNDYYDRYFSYSLNEYEISDIKVDDFISHISASSVSDLIESIKLLATNKNQAALIDKLRLAEDEIPPLDAGKLAKALSKLDNFIPYIDASSNFFRTPFMQMVILVRNLLKNQQGIERDLLVNELMTSSKPLVFSINLFYSIRKRPDFNDDGLLSDDEAAQFGSILAKRVSQELQAVDVLTLDNSILRSYINIWGNYGNKEEFLSFFTSLTSVKETLIKLLRAYLPCGSFSRERYDELTAHIPSDLILGGLEREFGKPIPIDSYPKLDIFDDFNGTEEDTVKAAIRLFVEIYNAIKEKESATTN